MQRRGLRAGNRDSVGVCRYQNYLHADMGLSSDGLSRGHGDGSSHATELGFCRSFYFPLFAVIHFAFVRYRGMVEERNLVHLASHPEASSAILLIG
jgi:hypothetical protein